MLVKLLIFNEFQIAFLPAITVFTSFMPRKYLHYLCSLPYMKFKFILISLYVDDD